MSKWTYHDDGTAHADGTGTYGAGWYAAAPSTVEAGTEPDAWPFASRELAAARAADLAAAERRDVRALLQDIIDDGRLVCATDAGNGAGGPMILTPDDLRGILESGEADGYRIIDRVDGGERDGASASEIIAETLQACGVQDSAATSWLLAERVSGQGRNPYRRFLILWETV